MRTYMDAYGLRPLERVRVWRLKMDFRNAISQRGNEARARPGGHTYLRRSVYICWILTKIIQFAPYRQSRPCCRQLDRTILCAHNSRVTITQLRVTKKNRKKSSKCPRLSRIVHPQFQLMRLKYRSILNVISQALFYCFDHQLLETLRENYSWKSNVFFSTFISDTGACNV